MSTGLAKVTKFEDIKQKDDTMYGDGDDNPPIGISCVKIEQANNGWVVITEYVDEDGEVMEITDVFNNDAEAVKHVAITMGVENKVEVKEK